MLASWLHLLDVTSNCQITQRRFSIDIEKLQENLSKNQNTITAVKSFPSTARDIFIEDRFSVDYAKVYACAEEVAKKKHGELQISITPMRYQPNDDSTKTVTLNMQSLRERWADAGNRMCAGEEIAAMAAEEFDAAQV